MFWLSQQELDKKQPPAFFRLVSQKPTKLFNLTSLEYRIPSQSMDTEDLQSLTDTTKREKTTIPQIKMFSMSSNASSIRLEADLRQLHKQHVLLREEGRGCFGRVYKCKDLDDGRVKALKVITMNKKSSRVM